MTISRWQLGCLDSVIKENKQDVRLTATDLVRQTNTSPYTKVPFSPASDMALLLLIWGDIKIYLWPLTALGLIVNTNNGLQILVHFGGCCCPWTSWMVTRWARSADWSVFLASLDQAPFFFDRSKLFGEALKGMTSVGHPVHRRYVQPLMGAQSLIPVFCLSVQAC